MDLVLDQCQRGTNIPKIDLIIPSIIKEINISNITSSILKGYLEKYNPSQVDQLFHEITLDNIMGNSSESKEEFANEVNKSAKLWPSELSKQIRLIETPFPGIL